MLSGERIPRQSESLGEAMQGFGEGSSGGLRGGGGCGRYVCCSLVLPHDLPMVRTILCVLALLTGGAAQSTSDSIREMVEELAEPARSQAVAAELNALGADAVPDLFRALLQERPGSHNENIAYWNQLANLLASMPEHSAAIAPQLIERLGSMAQLPNTIQLFKVLFAVAPHLDRELITTTLNDDVMQFDAETKQFQSMDSKLSDGLRLGDLPSLLRCVESQSQIHGRLAIDKALPLLKGIDAIVLQSWVEALARCAVRPNAICRVSLGGGRWRYVSISYSGLAASRALLKIAPSHSITLAALIAQLLNHPDPKRRAEAALTLGQRGDLASGAIEALEDALRNETNGQVLQQVINTTSMLGAKAEGAQWLLRGFTASEDRAIAVLARAAVVQVCRPLADRRHEYSYPNGVRKCVGDYRDGLMEGVWTFWAINGTKQSEGTYCGGELDGEWKTWYPNGELKGVGSYVEGRRAGAWVFYYDSGDKHSEGPFRLGEMHGDWSFWSWQGVVDGLKSGKYVDGMLQE